MVNTKRIVIDLKKKLKSMDPAERTEFLKNLGFEVESKKTMVRRRQRRRVGSRIKSAKVTAE